MSKRRSILDTDTSQDDRESSEADHPPRKAFRFINLSNNDPNMQEKNLAKAQSHAMKIARRRQRTGGRHGEFIVVSSPGIQAIFKKVYSNTMPISMGQSLLSTAS